MHFGLFCFFLEETGEEGEAQGSLRELVQVLRS